MTTKYKKEDVIPIIYYALKLMVLDLIEAVFKFAIEKYYPDLKGQLNHYVNELDESTLELLRSHDDDEIIYYVSRYIEDMDDVAESISILYDLDVDKIWDDVQIYEQVNNLRISTCSFLLRVNNIQESLRDLERFTESICTTLHYLCKLVIFEELDLDTVYNDDLYNSFYEDSFTMNGEEEDVNEVMLSELLLRISEYNEGLSALVLVEPGYAGKIDPS